MPRRSSASSARAIDPVPEITGVAFTIRSESGWGRIDLRTILVDDHAVADHVEQVPSTGSVAISALTNLRRRVPCESFLSHVMACKPPVYFCGNYSYNRCCHVLLADLGPDELVILVFCRICIHLLHHNYVPILDAKEVHSQGRHRRRLSCIQCLFHSCRRRIRPMIA